MDAEGLILHDGADAIKSNYGVSPIFVICDIIHYTLEIIYSGLGTEWNGTVASFCMSFTQ